MNKVTAKIERMGDTTRPRVVQRGREYLREEGGVLQYKYEGGCWITDFRITPDLREMARDVLAQPTEVIPGEEVVTLTMPKEIAITLATLTGKVVGPSVLTYRGDADAVLDALGWAGVHPDYSRTKLNSAVWAEDRKVAADRRVVE